jgi:hypothetical protein
MKQLEDFKTFGSAQPTGNPAIDIVTMTERNGVITQEIKQDVRITLIRNRALINQCADLYDNVGYVLPQLRTPDVDMITGGRASVNEVIKDAINTVDSSSIKLPVPTPPSDEVEEFIAHVLKDDVPEPPRSTSHSTFPASDMEDDAQRVMCDDDEYDMGLSKELCHAYIAGY